MGIVPVLFALTLLSACPPPRGPSSISTRSATWPSPGESVQIKEVELDDGVCEVEGYDQGGAKIKMKVDARSGIIIKLKRHD